jgi:hypothetical protein
MRFSSDRILFMEQFAGMTQSLSQSRRLAFNI